MILIHSVCVDMRNERREQSKHR